MTFARLRTFLFPDRGVLLRAPYASVAAAAIAIGSAAAFMPALQRVEWTLYDLFSRRIADRIDEPAPSLVVVAIDEPSFGQIGMPWPWPRSLHAALIEQLAAGGARTIALDILFDVPGANPQDDEALAEAMRRAGNVVLATDQASIEDRGYSLTQWTDPIAVLAKEAVSLGAVRIPYDPDAVLRRAALTVDGRPSLALAIASREKALVSPPRQERSRLFAFNGRPRQGIRTVSYYQALDRDGSLPAGIFEGMHVLVGRSLAATSIDEQADHFTTPVGVRMAGVEIHATIVDALLRGRFVADPFGRWAALAALCFGIGALFAAAAFRLGPIAAPVLAAAIAALVAGAGYLSLTALIRLPVVAPVVVVATVYVLTAAYRFGLVTKERRLIKRAFQHYVAPAIVDQMLNDPSKLKLGGEEYEVTVLFSDLEGFTTLSEHLSPPQLTAHLGGYFKEMLDVLLAERGTLDKLIGDAIMVYFGAPIRDRSHAEQACRAALAMQARMNQLNARWAAQGLPALRTRIGVNSGRAVAGNMGTDTIFNYTILGDCVNLASRLEGVNKEYDTLILVGEDSWARVAGAFEGRELDWIRVKGKARPVAIYELAGLAGTLDPRRREVFSRFAEALALYRAGRWMDAGSRFERVLEIDPADGPSRTLLARCTAYAASPPDGWEGVHVMKTK